MPTGLDSYICEKNRNQLFMIYYPRVHNIELCSLVQGKIAEEHRERAKIRKIRKSIYCLYYEFGKAIKYNKASD